MSDNRVGTIELLPLYGTAILPRLFRYLTIRENNAKLGLAQKAKIPLTAEAVKKEILPTEVGSSFKLFLQLTPFWSLRAKRAGGKLLKQTS